MLHIIQCLIITMTTHDFPETFAIMLMIARADTEKVQFTGHHLLCLCSLQGQQNNITCNKETVVSLLVSPTLYCLIKIMSYLILKGVDAQQFLKYKT